MPPTGLKAGAAKARASPAPPPGAATATAYRNGWRERGGLILQIESPEGLAAAPEIAAVPGVTQLFFGPSDFSACLGTDRGDPRIAAAAREVARIARAAGREAGTVTFPGGGFAELAAMGFTHVLDASDIARPRPGARREPRRRPPGARPWARVSSPPTRAG